LDAPINGLLLKLNEDKTGRPGFWFWKLFSSIRQDLDRYFWCFADQPWMALPLDLLERHGGFEEEVMEPFEERVQTSIQLWRPCALSKYASSFAEEHVELWAIEPELDDPRRMAPLYSDGGWNEQDNFVQEHARVWLLYTDSTCWEIFARNETLLNRVNESLDGMSWVDVFRSDSNRRGQAYGMAGLSEVWQALKG
jgi:hypothetical protein